MSNAIEFAPDVQGTIAAKRAEYFEWSAILGELIDNAFDADATRVEIALNGRELTVSDDGNGCDDIARMLTMGRHARRSTTRLGRYGVGLKDAAWWIGGPTRIKTHHAGMLHTIHIDWDALDAWSAPMPASIASADRGTMIRFESIGKERRFPDGDRLASMIKDLGFAYSPALKQGKQIVFRRGNKEPVLLRRHELPPMVETIEREISVDGKTARLLVGIVTPGAENPRPGISYTHGFRVIMHGAIGCGGLGTSRIAGWVSLGDGWRLARNKNDVTAYKDDLADAVFDVIRPLVEKASGQALTIKSNALANGLTSMFRGIVDTSENNAKAARGPAKNATGAVKPTGTGPKHGRARSTQPGKRFPGLVRAGQCRIDFKPCDNGAIGEVDRDGHVIWLADNHVTIQAAKAANDEMALLVLAVTLFASHEVHAEAPLLSMLRDESVAPRVELVTGRLLAEMHAARPAALKAV